MHTVGQGSVLYCILPTNGRQLPAFPLEVGPGTELRSQRWEARVLPLCHSGPPCDVCYVIQRCHTSLMFLSPYDNRVFKLGPNLGYGYYPT